MKSLLPNRYFANKMQNIQDNPTILAIDTATEACSVAVATANVEYCAFEICPQQHSQKILPMVQAQLSKAGIGLDDVDVIGFGHGPGSFTGVRIAIATVQGLALGLERPVVGVSTLAALAEEALANVDSGEALVAIDARMSEVYLGHFEKNQNGIIALKEEQVTAPENVDDTWLNARTVIAGTGWAAYPHLASLAEQFGLEAKVTLPNAQFMLPIVKRKLSDGLAQSIEDVKPVYLRDTVTWKKLPGR